MRIVRLVLGTYLLLPAVASAQVTSAISGTVRDESGLVLPGVTVEAASPALIEKVRVVVTDSRGIYRIVNLRPGTYRVTFTLPGFSQFVREGIALTANFTASVDATLPVGAVEESVTVTGAAPLVDTSNVQAIEVFGREATDALPIAQTAGVWATLIPAMRSPPTADGGATGGVDVGATQSERSQSQITVHGGTADVKIVKDGMEAMRGVYSANRLDTQEISVQMAGNPAESETGGVQINLVPREGSSIFSGDFQVDGTAEALQGSNIDDELRARGLVGTPFVKRAYHVGGALGGPISQERMWFFTSWRRWGAQNWLPGKYHNATQGTPVYTADLSRPAHTDDYYSSFTSRVTWQATTNNKFNLSYENQSNCNCVLRLIAENRAIEATGDHVYRVNIPQFNWQYTASSRLLFEAGVTWYRGRRENQPVEGVSASDLAIRERSTGFLYNARADNVGATGGYGVSSHRENIAERFAVSYVTGSHNMKAGIWVQQWPEFQEFYVNGGMRLDFRNGVPLAVTVRASPDHRNTFAQNLGVFVQDQWTLDQLTLNLGVRLDTYRGRASETVIPAGPFLPERRFAETDTLISLKDLNPRMGVAYDLFGDGRTALRGFLGRFIVGQVGAVGGAEPAALVVASANRTWNDRNGDFFPQEDELGPLSNSEFGSPRPSGITVDENTRFGWGNRDYTWQAIVAVEHEIVPGVGLELAYYRTWWGNQQFEDNLAVSPTDFDPYCITAPVDSRLPGGGGNEICGLYDIIPAKFGDADTLISLAGDRRKHIFNGVDVNVAARFGNGATLSGGLATGQTVIDDCGAAVDSPQALRFCRNVFSWSDDIQVKLNGSYIFPWDLRTSVVFSSVPGFPISATYPASNAEIRPSLGRNLSAGARGTSDVELIEPNTLFENRTNLFDLRFARRFTLGDVDVTGNFDIHNLFNANTPQHVNVAYGSTWLNVINAMSARVVRLGVQVSF